VPVGICFIAHTNADGILLVVNSTFCAIYSAIGKMDRIICLSQLMVVLKRTVAGRALASQHSQEAGHIAEVTLDQRAGLRSPFSLRLPVPDGLFAKHACRPLFNVSPIGDTLFSTLPEPVFSLP
jgi:hypothetical protein